MLSDRGTTEDAGDCYGLNLVYSGNHYEAVEVTAMEKQDLFLESIHRIFAGS